MGTDSGARRLGLEWRKGCWAGSDKARVPVWPRLQPADWLEEDSHTSGGHSPEPNIGTQSDTHVGVDRSMRQKICNETDGCYDRDPFLSLAFLSLSMPAGPITPRMCLSRSAWLSASMESRVPGHVPSASSLSAAPSSQLPHPQQGVVAQAPYLPPQPKPRQREASAHLLLLAPRRAAELEAHPGEQRRLSLESCQPPWF